MTPQFNLELEGMVIIPFSGSNLGGLLTCALQLNKPF